VWSLCWLVALVMLMRLVIIQHDCGHYSLYRSRRINDWIGYLISPLTTIPFGYWRLSHNIHHSNQSNLDARSDTEYPTLTTDEYQQLSPREQRRYQLTRSALGVCFIIPILLLVGVYRVPNRVAREARLTRSMLLLDVALISLWILSYVGLSPAFGVWLISMQVTLMCTAFIFFYFQHQYEQSYWAPRSEFNFVTAGLQGSSYLDTSWLMHWCSGNIGYHHVHHLCSKIPNYALPEAHRLCLARGYHPHTLRLRDIYQTFHYALWDTQQEKLISFSQYHASRET